MPRKPRIEYENAWHHVFNRGATHQCIFYNNSQRKLFLNLFNEITERFAIEIHAYCLMTNHFHLLVRTPHANLRKAMQYLLGCYTQKFNFFNARDGALLRGRYKSIVVEENSYLLQVCRYIHLNPLAANMCQQLREYPWSSYLSYVNRYKYPWLHTSYILEMFESAHAIERFKTFHDQGIDTEIRKAYAKNSRVSVLGSEAFIKMLEEKMKNPKPAASVQEIPK